MRKLVLWWIAFFAVNISLRAQALQQSANDAWLITRMAEKFHVQPRPLDDSMSSALFSHVLEELDEERIFFTREDIAKLSTFQYSLDDEVRNRQSGFLQQVIAIYKLRVVQADTMIDHFTRTPFNFQIREKFTAADVRSYPSGLEGMHSKLYKLLKYYILNNLTDYLVISPGILSKKYTDSLESVLRKKAASTVRRSLKRILQSPKGIDYMIGTIYCQSLATCYDPHTAFFQPEAKTAFESRLGNKPLSFGLSLDEDEDGNAEVGKLQPGGPAFLSGSINEGDKIQSIQWDDKEPIDVSTAQTSEIDGILADEGGSKLTLTIKKADGLTRQVVLHKEKVAADEDEDKVKGFILKGNRAVGYISLPAFYNDWENSKGVNGCANDVAKEIIKLKKDNMEGLILDLRYNGGGSMQEAIELSGIFIDAGPVAQIKTREAKIITLKDVNRGTVWDGPLLILINGLSASASEMVAGTLQDYNRALIAGSPSYGKATAQIVLPMDTTVNPDMYTGQQEAASYIKITTSRLYRITGKSAQVFGVKPDILLPEPSDAYQQREADEKYALPASAIDANKYYRALAALPVAAAAGEAKKAVDSSIYFQDAIRSARKRRSMEIPTDVSLYIDDMLEEKRAALKEDRPSVGASGVTTTANSNPVFTVNNPAYEKQRLASDSSLKEINEERKANVSNDPYVKIAYRIVSVMIK